MQYISLGTWLPEIHNWVLCYKLLFVQCAWQILRVAWCKYCKFIYFSGIQLMLYLVLLTILFWLNNPTREWSDVIIDYICDLLVISWLNKEWLACRLYASLMHLLCYCLLCSSLLVVPLDVCCSLFCLEK